MDGTERPATGNAGLHDLLMIALCTVLCGDGGQGAGDMALFAATKQRFLCGFLKLKHGVPSSGATADYDLAVAAVGLALPLPTAHGSAGYASWCARP